MKNIWTCRRTSIAVLAIGALFALGYYKDADVATSIAAVAMGLAGANSAEKFMKKD